MSKILKLTLKKLPFEVMEKGEKTMEFRKPSKWIESRLFDKQGNPRVYDFVEFTNGYGRNRPRFVAQYKYIIKTQIQETFRFSNGLQVTVEPGDYIIGFIKKD